MIPSTDQVTTFILNGDVDKLVPFLTDKRAAELEAETDNLLAPLTAFLHPITIKGKVRDLLSKWKQPRNEWGKGYAEPFGGAGANEPFWMDKKPDAAKLLSDVLSKFGWTVSNIKKVARYEIDEYSRQDKTPPAYVFEKDGKLLTNAGFSMLARELTSIDDPDEVLPEADHVVMIRVSDAYGSRITVYDATALPVVLARDPYRALTGLKAIAEFSSYKNDELKTDFGGDVMRELLAAKGFSYSTDQMWVAKSNKLDALKTMQEHDLTRPLSVGSMPEPERIQLFEGILRSAFADLDLRIASTSLTWVDVDGIQIGYPARMSASCTKRISLSRIYKPQDWADELTRIASSTAYIDDASLQQAVHNTLLRATETKSKTGKVNLLAAVFDSNVKRGDVEVNYSKAEGPRESDSLYVTVSFDIAVTGISGVKPDVVRYDNRPLTLDVPTDLDTEVLTGIGDVISYLDIDDATFTITKMGRYGEPISVDDTDDEGEDTEREGRATIKYPEQVAVRISVGLDLASLTDEPERYVGAAIEELKDVMDGLYLGMSGAWDDDGTDFADLMRNNIDVVGTEGDITDSDFTIHYDADDSKVTIETPKSLTPEGKLNLVGVADVGITPYFE